MSATSNPEGLAIARQLIAREAEEKTGFLDLGLLGLVEPPHELLKLTHLHNLNLGRGWRDAAHGKWQKPSHAVAPNTLSASWAKLSALSNLKYLHLVMDGPEEINFLGTLVSVRSLNLTGTQVSNLKPLEKLTALNSLDCSHTQISDLKPLEKLSALNTLDCSHTQARDCKPLEKLTALTSLDCSYSQVSDLKPLEQLTALKSLDCSYTQVSDLKPLEKLTTLISLHCSETEISDLEPLEKLTALTSLHCSETQVSDLKPLEKLFALNSLDCSHTQVSNLKPLEMLSALKSLDCSHTQVSNLKPLEMLSALKSLNCSRTQVSDLKPLEMLSSLTSLDCWGTQVSDLKPLEKLSSLTSLDCSHTLIRDLKPLEKLSSLTSLDCQNTQVSDLKPLEKLTALKSLNCSRTQVSEVPDWLIWRKPLTRLFLYKVSLSGMPKEVLSPNNYTSCLEQLRAHLADLQSGRNWLPDVKMVVIGNGRIGKTQICRRLRGEGFDAEVDSTHGITVTSAPMAGEPPAHLHLWDFGGQDLYHGTHALFMKTRAVFVLVWTPSAENAETHEHGGMTFRNQPLSYWLSYVRHLGGTDSPVLIVQNQCDTPADELLHPPLDAAALDGFGFRKLLHYSAKLDRGRAALNEALRDSIAWLREKQGTASIGKGRLAVKRRLEAMRDADAALPLAEKRHRTITQEHFQELCDSEQGISSPAMLLEYLHHCGIVFHQKGIFGDRIVLDQAWALEAVYAVFNRQKCFKQLQQLQGRFTRTLLEALVWQDFSIEEQKLFLSLMQSCGICFIHRDGTYDEKVETEYIAPDLLPDRESVASEIEALWPAAADFEETVIEYPFLHAGMVRSVIARVGREAGMNAIYWKEGVCGYERITRSHLLLEVRPKASESSPYAGELVVRTTGAQSAELLRRIEEWIQHEESKLGTTPNRKAAPKAPRSVTAEAGEAAQMEPKLEFDTPPRTGTTYCVSYAWRDDSIKVVDDLCKHAEKDRGVSILRDTTGLGLGERISKFMHKLAEGDRIFIILSAKYLQSPYCMAELLEVWRNSRERDGDFLQRVRVFRLPDAKMMSPLERAQCAVFWKKQFEELNAIVKEHGADLLGESDFQKYKLMQDFAHRVGDILALIADTLQPKDFAQFVEHGFGD